MLPYGRRIILKRDVCINVRIVKLAYFTKSNDVRHVWAGSKANANVMKQFGVSFGNLIFQPRMALKRRFTTVTVVIKKFFTGDNISLSDKY